MSRGLKQFRYGSAFIVVFLGVVFAVYALYFSAPPTCFDGKQNQGEEGVDCGGSCEALCGIASAKPISLWGTPRVFRTDTNISSLLVGIQNPNLDFALRSFSYEARLYDSSDALIETVRGESYIHAGEFKYLFFAPVHVPPQDVHRVEFASSEYVWERAGDFLRPSVALQNFVAERETENFFVRGNIQNNDTETLGQVDIISIFFGDLGQQVGASFTRVESISPGESKRFAISHPFIAGAVLGATKVFVYGKRQ